MNSVLVLSYVLNKSSEKLSLFAEPYVFVIAVIVCHWDNLGFPKALDHF